MTRKLQPPTVTAPPLEFLSCPEPGKWFWVLWKLCSAIPICFMLLMQTVRRAASRDLNCHHPSDYQDGDDHDDHHQLDEGKPSFPKASDHENTPLDEIVDGSPAATIAQGFNPQIIHGGRSPDNGSENRDMSN